MNRSNNYFRFILAVALMLFNISAYGSAYLGKVTIKYLYTEQAGSNPPMVFFGKEGSLPSDTCLFWNRAWRFDPSTPQGDAIFKILLSAKMSGAKVNIWYWPSTKPGTTHANGCGFMDVAQVYGIGIAD